MSVTGTLAAFALWHTCRRLAGPGGKPDAPDSPPEWLTGQLDTVVDWVSNRFTDHSQTLPKALGRANDRAWQAVGLALAGDGLFASATAWLQGSDMAAVRDQIRGFLTATPTGFDAAAAPDRRAACGELTRLRKSGRLAHPIDRAALSNDIRRLSAPGELVQAAGSAVGAVADALQADAPHLARLLRLSPPGGPPLLVAAFVFFFRREVETNDELARSLTFDSLNRLTAAQDRGFALLDGRTEGILDQIGMLFDELGEIRRILEDWRTANKVPPADTTAPPTVSVSNEREHKRLRALRDRLRTLPAEILDFADLDDLGDDQDACGWYVEALAARRAAITKARADADRAAEAVAEFKAYRDACEAGQWEPALAAIRRAAELDPARFEPFPFDRYVPVRVVGAGGFGIVTHCRDRLKKSRDVAVKSLHTADLGRDLDDVFEEAHTVSELDDPAIIRVYHWDFADRAGTRPYLVMEFFDGVSLAAHVKAHGLLSVPDFVAVARSIAEAMRAAHAAGVIHRDLKPANILVRRNPGGGWEVRVIDFGLAVRLETALVSTSRPRNTRRDHSFAGSIDYASPEQRNPSAGVPVGPPSDVYSFGRTLLEALLGTRMPITEDWAVVPAGVREPIQRLLEKCVADLPGRRHQGFEPVAAALAAIDPAEQAAREKAEAAARIKAEAAARAEAQAEAARVAALKQQEDEAALTRQRLDALQKERDHREHADRLELWKRSGEPREWVLRHLDGWSHDQWTGMVGRLKSSPYWPLRADAIGACLEGLRDTLRAAHDRQRAEQAAQEQREAEARGKADEEAKANDPLHPGRARKAGDKVEIALPAGAKMPFAWCPPGTFLMGSEKGVGNEKPVHKVTLTKGFFMGITPVTQAQWKAVMGTDPSHFKGPNRPVEQVSWDDCQEFAKALTAHLKGRVTLRLPTEAEWEYACRAGTTTEYHFGDRITPDLANYNGNYTWNGSPKGKYRQETTDVGTFPASPWGLYDVHGNIWEWCQDAWNGTFYGKSPTKDPVYNSNQTFGRVFRGGSWDFIPRYCRAAYRYRGERDRRDANFGCRLVFRLD